MKIAINCFDYGRTAITGAGIYYEQLANLLMQHGHNVDVYCLKYPTADHSQSAIVYPWRMAGKHGQYDLVLCPPDLAGRCEKLSKNIVAIVQRDHVPPYQYSRIKGVIFCSEHLQRKYMIHSKTMVWRPMCRIAERQTPREFAKVVGAVNLSNSKGGMQVFELARRFQTWEFIAIHQHLNFRDLPENVTVLKWCNSPTFMNDFYDKVGIMYLPYKSEGYNTVALEAVSQHIPILGNNIAGVSEVMQPETCVDLCRWDEKVHKAACNLVASRWGQIRGLNNTFELLNFIS